METKYTLYGGELSLYTGKARAYMCYKDLDWREELATKEVYRDTIVPNIGAPIIPVLETAEGEFVQDTTDIIDFLEARHPQGSVYPSTALQKLVALLLELYGDEWLVMPAMHYRWNVLDQQYDFIMSEFGRMHAPAASFDEQVAVGEKISARFRKSTTFLGVSPETIPGVEAAYLLLLEQLDQHFAEHDYLLGSRPCIGDYGFMGPLYAHLGRDPVPKALMQEKAPNVYAWVQRMNNPEPLSGEFVPGDEVPETLIPILKTMCQDHLPEVLDVIEHNAAWLAENPGGNLPRNLGMHDFCIGGSNGQRWIHSYAQWMFQRPLDHYQSLAGIDRQRADDLLRTIGGYEVLNTPINHRVMRKAGQLELVGSRA